MVVLAGSAGPAVRAQAPAPGQAAGHQRWIVMFHTRSFDLSPLGAAVRNAAAGPALPEVVHRLEQQVQADQAEFVAWVTGLGARVREQWWIVNACTVEVTADQLAQVRAHPRVATVHPDRWVSPAFIKTSTNNRNHHADEVQKAAILGKGATIAILDSGLDADMNAQGRPHRTFFVNGDITNKTGGGIGGSRLLANVKVGFLPAEDPIGHGTAVAAVAAGEVWGSTTTTDRGHAPMARVVGYGLSDRPDGYTLLSTMVSAWQRVVADRSTYGTTVANLSYEGTADPRSPEQQAMDAAARDGDIFIVVSAGNHGDDTTYGHGATNVLAVGSVHADTRAVAAFSARGPLLLDPQREYPALVANGVAIVMPEFDNESVDRIASGGSYAAPQVAGAAALYRSVKPSATALETRAAILATNEDVAGKNRWPPFDSRNAYGRGYLRDDRLVALAQGKLGGIAVQGTVTTAQPILSYPVPVVGGAWYAAVATWNRQNTQSTAWSNLDLVGVQGTLSLGNATQPRNPFEKLVFRAPATGTATIHVVGTTLESASQSFVLVVAEALPPYVPGMTRRYGQGCPDVTILTPDLHGLGDFELGRRYELQLTRTAPGVIAVFFVGASDRNWGALPLPLDLAPLGAPGCSLLASGEVLLGGLTSGTGELRRPVDVPNDPALFLAELYHQALVHSPATNALGLITSNGLAVTIAGDPNQ